MQGNSVLQCADDAICVEVSSTDQAIALSTALRATGYFEEVVPGMASVVATYDPLTVSAEKASSLIEAARVGAYPDSSPPSPIVLPVQFGEEDGPDLADVAAVVGVTPRDLVLIVTERSYKVALMGFTPGFAYIEGFTGVIPRREMPRQRIKAGSLGVGNRQLGAYALQGPGGWPIIGRIMTPLFSPDKEDNPFVLSSGQTVRFEAVS